MLRFSGPQSTADWPVLPLPRVQELPEQSPMSTSLMTRINELGMNKDEGDPLAEEDSFKMPGTSMLAPPSARQV